MNATLPALILLLALSAPVKGDIPCTVDSSKCVCSSTNFTLSIGDAFPKGWVNVTDSISPANSFVLSPCKDFRCGGKPSRVCQWDAGSDAFHVIGTAEEVEWSVESASKFKVTFGKGDLLFNGHVRAGKVSCLTDASVTEPKYSYDGEGDPNTDNPLVYSFTVTAKSFTTPSGGGGGGNVAGIAGIVIILLLLIAVALYFIIGAVVRYTVKGARGTEIIPNGAFWKDLPFLVKDGFMFTFAPCVNKIREKRGYSSL